MSDFRVESVSNSNAGSTITPSGKCVIRVLGIGGGGGNSLQHMINDSLSGVEFIAVNTDSQALSKSTSPLKVQIGVKLTNCLVQVVILIRVVKQLRKARKTSRN